MIDDDFYTTRPKRVRIKYDPEVGSWTLTGYDPSTGKITEARWDSAFYTQVLPWVPEFIAHTERWGAVWPWTPPADIPLPGERFQDQTVIASVYLRDDDPVTVLLLTLMPTAPYYRVQEIEWRPGEGWVTTWSHDLRNILLAMESYQRNGGDY